MKKNSLVIGMLLFTAYLSAQTAKGYVFEDTNSNGIKDRKEKDFVKIQIQCKYRATKILRYPIYVSLRMSFL
ncbi:MAG: hypothetical protein DI539_23505 [Flavobacterium psychrophilum]|nr:MAG: hypothetical protein DI539_23505 [Flavobacterium psychrophilum]